MKREASPRVAGLVLAAGASTRMGPDRNKLLEIVDGRALVLWPIEALRRAGVSEIFVVTGFESERVREVIEAAGMESAKGVSATTIHVVPNTGWRQGMGSSLACGARAVIDAGDASGAPFEAILVCMGDLPGLDDEAVAALLSAYQDGPPDAEDGVPAWTRARICVPVRAGREGHPVLFGANHFPALAALEGDRGARPILEAHEGDIVRVPVASDGILRDVDTPEDLEAMRHPG